MKHLKVVEGNHLLNHAASDLWRKAIQNHRGVRRNPRAAARWQKVAHATAVEASYQPAAESVRVAKTGFAIAGPAARRREARGPLELQYDSYLQPVPMGTRSAPMNIRQMLYRADPFQIDIHIELRPEQNRFVVTGQLLDLSHPEMVARDVQVTLSDGCEDIVNTVTNQFGEFHAEIKNSGDLEITFLASGGKPTVILLRGALDPLSPEKD